ncbi:hypothetical protein BS78_07G216000 [Paspalum vaginatum]|nr:hypothetical protein BS78_07G216000 [Paspalum vaginatum]
MEELKDVGILAMGIYFPPTCVQQSNDRRKRCRPSGLGQDCMSFCSEVEDVISMSLTVTASLLQKYKVDPELIGLLEVGSETVIDKSKSIKTWLMQIFEESGNTDIEGVDSSNACYGGTAALLNCVNWVESKSWDGRYGLVVCTDNAVYAEGPARPRPDLASEYPVVDGKLSQTCCLMALDSCYRQFCAKYEKLVGEQFSLSDADYCVFHSPYNKACLCKRVSLNFFFNDSMRNCSSVDNDAKEKLLPFANLTSEESYQSRDLEKTSQQVAKHLYDLKVQLSTLLPKQIGNMYTASLYAALASVIYNKHNSLASQRIIMFSYGSGLTSTLFSLRLHEGQHPFSLANIAFVLDVRAKLESRHASTGIAKN